MIDSIANNETGVSVRGKLNDMIDVVNGVDDPDASISPIVHYHGITDLTGGGATKLDGIATEDMDVGIVVAITIGSNQTFFYRLVAGTEAEATPFVVRPDDYATTTNEKYWRLVGFYFNSIFVAAGLTVGAPAEPDLATILIKDEDDITKVTLASDGTGEFAGSVTVAVAPTEDDHVTRKDYVDGVAGLGLQGSGSPEGSVAANPCRIYRNADTGALWWKVTGTGNTGWEQMTGPF